jgi:hypothetical protein
LNCAPKPRDHLRASKIIGASTITQTDQPLKNRNNIFLSPKVQKNIISAKIASGLKIIITFFFFFVGENKQMNGHQLAAGSSLLCSKIKRHKLKKKVNTGKKKKKK